MTKKSKTLPIVLAAVAVAAIAVLAFVWTQRDTRRQQLTDWLPTLLAFPDAGLAAAQQQMLEAVTPPADGQPGYVGADPSLAPRWSPRTPPTKTPTPTRCRSR